MCDSKNNARECELDKKHSLHKAATDFAAFVNLEKHDYDEGVKLATALEAAAVDYSEFLRTGA